MAGSRSRSDDIDRRPLATRGRRLGGAVVAALLLVPIVAAGCGDDSAPAKTPNTTHSEDAPDTGPQSGPNPAGGEPEPGTTPAGS